MPRPAGLEIPAFRVGAAGRPAEDQRPWVNVLPRVQHEGSEGHRVGGWQGVGPSELASALGGPWSWAVKSEGLRAEG